MNCYFMKNSLLILLAGNSNSLEDKCNQVKDRFGEYSLLTKIRHNRRFSMQ